jgi:hypothetical protein
VIVGTCCTGKVKFSSNNNRSKVSVDAQCFMYRSTQYGPFVDMNLINFMELSPSFEVATCAATQELSNILLNPNYFWYSQEASMGPCPEPDQSRPYHAILSL